MSERIARRVMAEWHAAERRLATRDPDAADFEEMTRAVERLRLEYQRLRVRAGGGRGLERAMDGAAARDVVRSTIEGIRHGATPSAEHARDMAGRAAD